MSILINLRYYHYDLDVDSEAEAYKLLCGQLKERGLGKLKLCTIPTGQGTMSMFRILGNYKSKLVELEPSYLFENQFNASGHRCFDWYEAYYQNRAIRSGYYAEHNEGYVQLQNLRTETYKCGWCGHQEKNPSSFYHEGCFSSEYLEGKDLHLTVYKSVANIDKYFYQKVKEEADLSELVEKYNRIQSITATKKLANKISDMMDQENTRHQKMLKFIDLLRNNYDYLLPYFKTKVVNFYTDKVYITKSRLNEAQLNSLIDHLKSQGIEYHVST